MLTAIGYYAPILAPIFVIALQIDLLKSIRKGNEVNLQARICDFLHWLLLSCIAMSTWLAGGISLGWFVLQLGILVVIGLQIESHTQFLGSRSSLLSATLAGLCALILGLLTGYARYSDHASLGWGTIMDSVSSIIAIMLVMGFIRHDLETISKNHTGYTRAMFIKGLLCNVCVTLGWLNVMSKGSWHDPLNWIQNFGFSFVIITGNAIYLRYYLLYEYYRFQQQKTA